MQPIERLRYWYGNTLLREALAMAVSMAVGAAAGLLLMPWLFG
jgi:hypothetical protein